VCFGSGPGSGCAISGGNGDWCHLHLQDLK
jgi:hypothetical protein